MKRALIGLALGAAMAACGAGGKPAAKDVRIPAPQPGFVAEELKVGDPGISFSSAADDYNSFVEYGPKGYGGVANPANGEPVSHTQQTYAVGTSPYYWPTEITVAIIPRDQGFGGHCPDSPCFQVQFTSSAHNDAYHPNLVGTVFIAGGDSQIVGTSARQVVGGVTSWYYPGAMYPGYFGLDSHNAGAQVLFSSSGGANPTTGSLSFSNGAAASIRQIYIVFPDGSSAPRPANAWIWASVEDPTGTYVYDQYSLATINPG